MAAISIGLVALVTGCGGGGSAGPTTPSAPPATAPAQARTVQAEPVSTGTQLYDGQAFAIAYPAGWWVHNAEQPKRFGTETTILDPADHSRVIRIDVASHPVDLPGTPAKGQGALPVRSTTFQGRPARRWSYVYHRDGRTLRLEAIVFNDDRGQGILIATQAPTSAYRSLAEFFDGVRGSYLPK